jgi:predicted metal-dependent phosphoesterase TrpH
MQIKADLHVHTTYSPDSMITPKDLVFYAKKKGLDAVAVTDHNRLEGSFKIASETKDLLIIPGMEVSSSEGHIVALNVKELVPRGLSAAQTVDRIHALGGVAIACHPFVFGKGCLKDRVCSTFDAIEIINARAFPFKRSVKKATETAERLNLPRVAGTDAHYGPQIGYGYAVIEASDKTVPAILNAIVEGKCQPFGSAVPITLNLMQEYQRVRRWLRRPKSQATG